MTCLIASTMVMTSWTTKGRILRKRAGATACDYSVRKHQARQGRDRISRHEYHTMSVLRASHPKGQNNSNGAEELNNSISGNSGRQAGARRAWREGVFDGQEVRSLTCTYSQTAPRSASIPGSVLNLQMDQFWIGADTSVQTLRAKQSCEIRRQAFGWHRRFASVDHRLQKVI